MLDMKGIAVIAIATVLASGCTALKSRPDDPVSTSTELKLLKKYFTVDVLAGYYSPEVSQRGGLNRKDYRDQITHARLRGYDIKFEHFAASLYRDRALIGVGGSWATLVLSGLGAVTSGASQELAAASAGVIGATASVDKEFFFEETVPALISTMNTKRSNVRASILRNLKKPDTEYSLGDALQELEGYRHAGSLLGAISEITQRAVAEEQRAAIHVELAVSGVASESDHARAKKLSAWGRDPKTDVAILSRILTSLSHAPGPKPRMMFDAIIAQYEADPEQFEALIAAVKTIANKEF